MFSPANSAVWVNGQTDNHLNTFWLRSPEFYLDGSGDLTAQLNHGIANAPDPASEPAIPFAAVTGGGWKGLIPQPRQCRDLGHHDQQVSPGRYQSELAGTDLHDLVLRHRQPGERHPARLPLPADIHHHRGGWQHQELHRPNLEDYAFGADPGDGKSGVIQFSLGSVTAYGQPWIHRTAGYALVFGRQADYLALGLTYKVQFSAELTEWLTDASPPAVIAADSEIQAVRVPFPATIPTSGGPKIPRFARVEITLD